MSFGMFNKKSQSTTNATTNHMGAQLSEVYGTAASTLGDGNTTNILDGGAIKDAFSGIGGAVSKAFDFADGSLDRSFDFGRDMVRDSNALANDVIERAFKTTNENSKSAFNAALQAVQPQPIDIKLVGIVAVGVVAIFYFMSQH